MMESIDHFNASCLSEVSTLLDCFTSPVVLISTDYEVLGTNKVYEKLHGGGQAILGRHCYEVSHHYNRPCHEMGEECPMLACLNSGEPQRVLHQHHTPNGEEHVEVGLRPLRNAKNQITAFLEIMRPIQSERDKEGKQKLIGRSKSFNHMLEMIGRVAPSDATALLLGESGTGKEVAAHAIHRASLRAEGPFVPVDCSGLTESLFESELFGHEKGAFTGANSRKQGLVEAARGGTLFLDEVGDIPLNLQVKLLRLLETGTFRRVGSVEPQQAEFRLVCATHRDLHGMVESGEFRRDLFYRISAFPIELPSLRERLDDLPLLVGALLERLSPERRPRLNDAALQCLKQYPFPGNIRELRNILERALLLCDGDEIGPEHLPVVDTHQAADAPPPPSPFSRIMPLQELESSYLKWAQSSHHGDKRSLAKALGVSERTLYRKLEKITE